MEYNEIIGRKLKERRESLGMTQAAIGEIMHVHHQMISKLETGKMDIKLEVFVSYCKALKINLGEILGYGTPELDTIEKMCHSQITSGFNSLRQY